MIEVKVHGDNWPDITRQIGNLIQSSGGAAELDAALEKKNRELTDDLTKARLEAEVLRDELKKSEQRISVLETELDAACAEVARLMSAEPEAEEPDAAPDENPPTPDQPAYKKEDVRAFLAEARGKGVNITDVLKPFGGRLPAVAEKDYPALMEAAKAAVAELEAK